MNCAAYWRRCLDDMVKITSNLLETDAEVESDENEYDSDDSGKFCLNYVIRNRFDRKSNILMLINMLIKVFL